SAHYLRFCCAHFIFLLVRRPPRSTLFPTRRSSDLLGYGGDTAHVWLAGDLVADAGVVINLLGGPDSSFLPANDGLSVTTGSDLRSEEHTSELQSRGHLVCRLLLEKKKKKNNIS